jgi:hypothetical protein
MLVYLSSISANVEALKATRERFLSMARLTRTYIALALVRGDEPWVDRDSSFNMMPTPRDVATVVERFDYPVDRRLAATRGQPAYEDALIFLLGDRFRVEHSSAHGSPSSLELVDARGLEVTSERRCIRAVGSGADAVLRLSVAGGARVRAMTSSDVAGIVGLGHGETPNRYRDLALRRGSSLDVVVPQVSGDPRKWFVLLSLPALRDRIVVCGLRARSATD